MEIEINKLVRTALAGIEGRNLEGWYRELNELMEQHELVLGRMEFINFLYNDVDIRFDKIFLIFDYMLDYYEPLFDEQKVFNFTFSNFDIDLNTQKLIPIRKEDTL